MGSEAAIAGWDRRFSSRQVNFSKEDELPFKPGRTLGRGGLGIVVETEIEGIAVAWKRTYTRRLTPQQTNEINILGQLSEQRHKHIVELVGSYTHRQRGIYELGILLWPVAQCDLAVFMHEVDALGQWINRWPHDVSVELVGSPTMTTPLTTALGPLCDISEEDESTWESLIAMNPGLDVYRSSLLHNLLELHRLSMLRLERCFRCLASAMLYLHSNGIRHKDLKPSQILLTAEGLWLTDFGWSKDVSSLTNSATSGGDTTTIRYEAPERVRFEACGRAEDMFALGCTYLEMIYCWMMIVPEEHMNPTGSRFWSYQASLSHVQEWMEPLKYLEYLLEDTMASKLRPLIESMLESSPSNRPSITTVVDKLRPGDDDRILCDCHRAWPLSPGLEPFSLSRDDASRRRGGHPSMRISHLLNSEE